MSRSAGETTGRTSLLGSLDLLGPLSVAARLPELARHLYSHTDRCVVRHESEPTGKTTGTTTGRTRLPALRVREPTTAAPNARPRDLGELTLRAMLIMA